MGDPGVEATHEISVSVSALHTQVLTFRHFKCNQQQHLFSLCLQVCLTEWTFTQQIQVPKWSYLHLLFHLLSRRTTSVCVYLSASEQLLNKIQV